ncbi:MetQ/NlpA family ABC transporter substrate-binding protein [Peptoniphilus sp. KCTC 25270]|uniref:MetQ/NlpA family ABC transporter substrate-binding protein n=1 Tax=Peptoniphilus sp. KCTC 25270 TaxID=2897414 RepID=UPI001E29F4B2|nr:MetQ/NlpA family ABC transporter substrate-binding protein [Peptoniphilus sp. KCTC 25270]MCD1147285.1 MetQ/NlpA family ABC transporter substrate-binding protein [Peptoniphilus sp. KCTC 25270]
MKKITTIATTIALSLTLAACGAGGNAPQEAASNAGAKPETIKIGFVGDNNEVWEDVAKRFTEGEGINVELISFTDYNQPNDALAAGDLDLNSFQHKKFLENYNKEQGADLVSIGDTVLAPIGLYSNKIKDVSEIKENDKIAIPDDVSNGSRSLILLQTAGLIKVDGQPGDDLTVDNITENPLNLEIIPMDASQTARSLDDVAVSAINNGMATDAGFIPTEDAIFLEPVDENSAPYVNIIVSRNADKDNEWYKKLVEYYQTEETKALIDKTSKGSQIIAWEEIQQ